MRQSFKTTIETRRIRLQRRSGEFLRDILVGLGLTGVVCLMAALMVWGYFVFIEASYFRLNKTVVTGCGKTSESDILALAELKPGQSLLTLNVDKVVRKIQANAWVETVALRRELPNRLAIEVKERKALALMRKENTLYFVDGNARPFKRLDDDENAELPILTGFSENGTDKTDLIKKSLELLGLLARNQEFPKLDNISELHGDEEQGFSVFTDNGMGMRLGFGDYQEKLKRLKLIMADLTRRNMAGPFFIDLNNPGKVVVQKKDAPAFPKFSKGYRT
jgi:cell division protein FtsQ